MPYIKFTSYEQVRQSREVIWKESDWEDYKLQIKQRAEGLENPYPGFDQQSFIDLYKGIKDIPFDTAIEEYNKWHDEEGGCLKVHIGYYDVCLGEFINDALYEAAEKVAPTTESTDYDYAEAEVCED